MFEVGLARICEEIGDAFKAGNLARVDALLWPALDQFSDLPQLWFYAGNLFFQTGRPALAVTAFERAIQLDDNPLLLSNLGAAYRRLNQHDNGLAALRSALERAPDYEPALVNYGAMFVNEGCPEKGIPSLERAVELGRKNGRLETGAEWNLALLYLEAARFAEGFDLYRTGYGAERLVRTYTYGDVAEPKRLTPEEHAAAVAGRSFGKDRPTLIVWGEQGVGDELMFGTVFNDAIYHYDVVFECHPRLEKLHKNSTWARALAEQGRPVRIYPTRKETHIGWPQAEGVRGDFKCPIGDLASYYRRDVESFKTAWSLNGPSYAYNVDEAESYRAHLEQIAQGRPIIGLAAHGGVMTTARQYRTMRSADIERLLSETDALFVGLDYDNMTPLVYHLHEKFGAGRYFWPAAISQHWDLDHVAALLAATDMNVMVCQSAFHMSAGIGAETRCLVPRRCAWRYAPLAHAVETSYWYPSERVRLYRQSEADSWRGPLDRVIADIRALSKTTGQSASGAGSDSLRSAETFAGVAASGGVT